MWRLRILKLPDALMSSAPATPTVPSMPVPTEDYLLRILNEAYPRNGLQTLRRHFSVLYEL